MEDVQELARTYRRILQLKSIPIAIRVIKNQDETPVQFKKPETPLPSFCFGIMEAFKGKGFFLKRGDVRCALGLTALGFNKEGSKSRKQKRPSQLGGSENDETARNSISNGISLPPGQTKGVAMSPLEKAVMGVDVVLFKVNSEQALWLLTAAQYNKNGASHDLHVGTGFQGVCGDVIVYPLIHEKVNLTVNGVGDRVSPSMGKNELFAGIPAGLIKKIADNLIELFHKPNFKVHHSPKGFLRAASSRNGLRP
jgi:uncharacterized protein (DUF169 family)